MDREYANVWTRFAAIVIDGLLVTPFYIPWYVLSWKAASANTIEMPGWVLALNLIFILGGVVFGFWNTIFRMGRTGQSLGRKFLNIAVLDENGRPIGAGRAFLREVIGRFVSGLICYIGYLNAFWDKRKQMWHDKMADCFVYYVEDDYRQGI